jgi:hypothetical protein
MNIIEAIAQYKKLSYKNKLNKGLSTSDNDEYFKLKTYIESNIITAIEEGYILVLDQNEDKSFDFNKPTKEQFKDYLVVQSSGITNMLDSSTVCKYSLNHLNKDNCLYIYEHYQELVDEYKISLDDIRPIDLIDHGLYE